ncbi:hypothetical protein WJX79_004911 [Trebouxia sp. C0005]
MTVRLADVARGMDAPTESVAGTQGLMDVGGDVTDEELNGPDWGVGDGSDDDGDYKQAAVDALTKNILEAGTLSTEEKQRLLQAVFTLLHNRPPVAPAVAGLGHTQGRVAPHRGGFAPARPVRNNTPYARGPTGGCGLRCAFCNRPGHSVEECRMIDRALDFRNGCQQ